MALRAIIHQDGTSSIQKKRLFGWKTIKKYSKETTEYLDNCNYYARAKIEMISE